MSNFSIIFLGFCVGIIVAIVTWARLEYLHKKDMQWWREKMLSDKDPRKELFDYLSRQKVIKDDVEI